jgi:O-antigen ligase
VKINSDKNKYGIFFILAGVLSICFWYFGSKYLKEIQLLMFSIGLLVLLLSFIELKIGVIVMIFSLYVPISIGNFMGIPNFLVFEAFTPLFVFYIILNKIITKENISFFRKKSNPLLYFLLLYFIWIYLEFFRNSATTGTGRRILFVFFLGFLLSLGLTELLSEKNKKQILSYIFFVCSFVVLLGLGLITLPVTQSIISKLQSSKLLATANNIVFASWQVGYFKQTFFGFYRIGFLQNTAPVSFLFLLSGVFNIRKTIRITGLVFFFILIIISGGRSFFAGTLMSLAFLFIIKKRGKSIPLLLILGFTIFILAFLNYESLPGPLKRIFFFKGNLKELDPGRSVLFSLFLNEFLKRPFIGQGFGSFRLVKFENETLNFLANQLTFGGHSTFLSLLYITGIIGLLIFLIIYIKSILLSYKRYKETEKPEYLLLLLFFIYIFIPFIFGGNGSDGAYFMFIGLLLGLNKLDIRENIYDKSSSYNT